MTPTEMEDAINNLDRRLSPVEQTLPSLATKGDLLNTRDELRREISAVRDDLRGEIGTTRAALHAELRATRTGLTDRIDEVNRHGDVRIEDAREDIRKVAEGVAAVATSLQANTRVLEDVVTRLDRHETILETLIKRGI